MDKLDNLSKIIEGILFVSGDGVSVDDIAEKLQYDMYYLKHRNLLWEIGILVKAVFLALGGRHG